VSGRIVQTAELAMAPPQQVHQQQEIQQQKTLQQPVRFRKIEHALETLQKAFSIYFKF
jgi:hypothetical protein